MEFQLLAFTLVKVQLAIFSVHESRAAKPKAQRDTIQSHTEELTDVKSQAIGIGAQAAFLFNFFCFFFGFFALVLFKPWKQIAILAAAFAQRLIAPVQMLFSAFVELATFV